MLQETISNAIKDAMRAKDSLRLNALRGIKTAFTNELVATKRTPQDTLTDDEAITVIARMTKQRRDSIDQFTKGGRLDLAEKEAEELAILETFLPTQLSREDVLQIVKAKQAELGVTDKAKAGMLIGALMKELKGKADGKLVKEVVESLFG
ncbi:MAG: GatB/YqeY domain-containing protein [Rhodothermales bacterium]|nr:GatB/YqeY domain-containing protein [Rhodothermales bacterium]